MKLFEVRHRYEIDPGVKSERGLGMYSSGELAQKAIDVALSMSGFRDYPAGFFIVEHELDPDAPRLDFLRAYTEKFSCKDKL